MDQKIKIISYLEYPKLLQQLEKPPTQLYIQGSLPTDDYKYLCVIGARRNSDYAKDACEYLIHGLIGHKIVIVSGLAVGIDSLAHEAALKTKLLTVAFPGSGLSPQVLYPSSRFGLSKRILEAGGALLSPFDVLHPATKWTFLQRNELMAAVSHATLIIEGREGSGTLITADHALRLGREVMIVPGSIFSELSYGPHLLMRDGATPITNSEEILAVLGFHNNKNTSINIQKSLWSTEEFSPAEKNIIDHLTMPTPRDDLIRKLNISLSQANVTLSELEIKGVLTESDGILRLRPK